MALAARADAGLRVDVRQREPLLLPLGFQELGDPREFNLGSFLAWSIHNENSKSQVASG
jgi:hypothetical protein